jgi:GntR family transcriptional regulator, transcriptional repressor for pyruvate dehydrogenase complex
MSYPKIGGARLSDKVAAELQHRILYGELRAGERLPNEAELGDALSVSRSVIRDAIRTLSARGLIRVRQGSGMVVTEPNENAVGAALALMLMRSDLTLSDAVEARISIDTEFAPVAALRGGEENWEHMAEVLRDFGRAIDDKNWETAQQHHLEFHLAMLEATQLPALKVMLAPMYRIMVLSSLPPVPGDPSLWDLEAHQRMLDALRSRDVEKTNAAVEYHFRRHRTDPRYLALQAAPFRDAPSLPALIEEINGLE